MISLEFLRAIWPDSGFYCLAAPKKTGDKSIWLHKVFDTIEEAAVEAQAIKHAQDVFFCVHSVKDKQVWNDRTKKWQVRTHENMAWVKTFFADLDVGIEEHKFHTRGGAINGLRDFLGQTGLPWPTIVSSGRGAHVYWVLREKTSSEIWKPYATKLKRLFTHHGFKADPSRVDDQASVLRVAGTYHLKDPANPRLVEVKYRGNPTSPTEFFKLVDDACTRAEITVSEAQNGPATKRTNLLEHSFDDTPVDIRALGGACGQFRWLVKNGPKLDNPQWYHGVLNTVRFCNDGHKWAHILSRTHGDYSTTETDSKLQQLELGNFGPTLCSRMEEICPTTICQRCPSYGKVKSPVVAAKRKPELAPSVVVQSSPSGSDSGDTFQLPDPPKPWSRLSGGGISKHIKRGKEQEELDIRIYDHDLYPLRLITNGSTGSRQSEWRVTLPKREPVDFLLDTASLYEPRALSLVLMNTGMVVSHDRLNDVRDYMIAYLQTLQRYIEDSQQYSHLGWTEENTAFILPDRILFKDKTRRANLSEGAQIASQFIGSRGTLEEQLESLKFYNHPEYIPHQFFILCSFAAPLFYATTHHGIIVNASGDPGASKSTALYMGASFWGVPDQYPINGTSDGATIRGRNERITTLANFPICVDEITRMDKDNAKNLALNITQPGERIRLKNNGVEQRGKQSMKSTIMMTTGNNSLHDLLASDNTAGTAGSMRLFEISCSRVHIHSIPEADAMLRRLARNYGHIGPKFMEYVVTHQVEVAARVAARQDSISINLNIGQDERFWGALIAAVTVAGEIAYGLGLHPFDMNMVYDWIVKEQLAGMRGVITQAYNQPIDILADYLEKVSNDILVLNRGLPGTGNIPNILRAPRGELLGRYEVDTDLLWIHRTSFRDHCLRVGAPFSTTKEKLVKSRIVTAANIRKQLGSGMPEYARGQTWCMLIDMAHPEICGRTELNTITPNYTQARNVRAIR
jgi:hypothetical protein